MGVGSSFNRDKCNFTGQFFLWVCYVIFIDAEKSSRIEPVVNACAALGMKIKPDASNRVRGEMRACVHACDEL